MRKKFCMTLVLVIVLVNLFAQPGNPPGDPEVRVPISGLGILLGVGAVLGIVRIVTRRGVSVDTQEGGETNGKRSASELLQWIRRM